MDPVVERRSTPASLQVRTDAETGTATLTGYASVFDTEAHGEIVRPSAFNKSLADGADVRLLVNHDGVPLARTTSGTLRLSVDETGLRVDADLDTQNPTVIELASAMDRGDIDQMSFAFRPVRDMVNDDGVRELVEVDLRDVSVVTYPWYETTSAELNSAAALVLAEARHIPAELAGRLRDAFASPEAVKSTAAPDVELERARARARKQRGRSQSRRLRRPRRPSGAPGHPDT